MRPSDFAIKIFAMLIVLYPAPVGLCVSTRLLAAIEKERAEAAHSMQVCFIDDERGRWDTNGTASSSLSLNQRPAELFSASLSGLALSLERGITAGMAHTSTEQQSGSKTFFEQQLWNQDYYCQAVLYILSEGA